LQILNVVLGGLKVGLGIIDGAARNLLLLICVHHAAALLGRKLYSCECRCGAFQLGLRSPQPIRRSNPFFMSDPVGVVQHAHGVFV
jgi:hypothetical protein